MLMTRPLRHQFTKKASSITAAFTLGLMTTSLTFASASSEGMALPDDSEYQQFSSTGTPDDGTVPGHENPSSGGTPNSGATILYGKGSSKMMATEFLISSDMYGGGIYRRYIGTKKVKGELVHSGVIVQELLVTPETIKDSPGLTFHSGQPQGLQITGIVAAKLWLKTVMEAGNDEPVDSPDKKYGACVKKPKKTDIPARYLKPRERTYSSWEWGQPIFELDKSREDCGLSLRLTSDETKHEEFLSISAELCRYPAEHFTYNGAIDDAECIHIGSTLKPKDKGQVFLSENNERLRTERSILLREVGRKSTTKEGGYLKGWVDSFVSTFVPADSTDGYQELGLVTEVFPAFLDNLNTLSGIAYNVELDQLYSYKVQHAEYDETIVAVDDGQGENFLKFLSNYPKGFKAALEAQKDTIDLADSGIEKTVSEFKHHGGSKAGSVAFKMTIEETKMAFYDSVTEEKLELFDKAKIDKVTKLTLQHDEFQKKLDTCYEDLNQTNEQCAELQAKLDKTTIELDTAQERQQDLERQVEQLKKDQEDKLKLKVDQVKLQADTDHRKDIDDLEVEYKGLLEQEKASKEKQKEELEAKYKLQLAQKDTDILGEQNKLKHKISILKSQNEQLQNHVERLKDVEEDYNDLRASKNNKIKQATQVLENERDSLKASNKKLSEQLTAEKSKSAAAEWKIKEEVQRYNSESRRVANEIFDLLQTASKYMDDAERYIDRPWGSDVPKPKRPFTQEFKLKEHNNGTMFIEKVY